MVALRKVLAAGLAGALVIVSVEAASARHLRTYKHGRVVRHWRAHRVVAAPIVQGSPVGVALGLVGPGIPSATTAAPYPPGYGFYGPGNDFYGPGTAFPGY